MVTGFGYAHEALYHAGPPPPPMVKTAVLTVLSENPALYAIALTVSDALTVIAPCYTVPWLDEHCWSPRTPVVTPVLAFPLVIFLAFLSHLIRKQTKAHIERSGLLQRSCREPLSTVPFAI